MRISIIVPTRERAHYLSSCLDSCLATDDPDLEIVVSDNASQDDTAAVVASKNDARIVYTNTGRRVSMRANFEHALNHASGDYIVYIGDDDAVLASGLRTLRSLIERWQPDAIGWRLIHYLWPAEDGSRPGRLEIPLKSIYGELRQKDPAAILRNFAAAKVRSYKDGANLYHGCVSRKVIEKTRSRDGVYFHSLSPDVYASIANLAHIQTFLWLRHPLTLGGESDRSNGRAFSNRMPSNKLSETSAQIFMSEVEGDPYGGEIDAKVFSIDAHIHATMILANEVTFRGNLAIDHGAWARRVLRTTQNIQGDRIEESLLLYKKFLKSHSLPEAIAELDKRPFAQGDRALRNGERRKAFLLPSSGSELPNVAAAAKAADSALCSYCPAKAGGARFSLRGSALLFRAIARAIAA
ncbi:glycosyltransferase [Stappia sp. F7233]|uniref:Glycosyltransferase n=1 Tax=Stappia albiluteola TaxID=2758565 RepID=A0A839AFP3_9HYPH|nr:glycosyltransferase [Stappia albiluteola]MBA5778533.1 glycosyltransferase [Stappia albiluteola]